MLPIVLSFKRGLCAKHYYIDGIQYFNVYSHNVEFLARNDTYYDTIEEFDVDSKAEYSA